MKRLIASIVFGIAAISLTGCQSNADFNNEQKQHCIDQGGTWWYERHFSTIYRCDINGQTISRW